MRHIQTHKINLCNSEIDITHMELPHDEYALRVNHSREKSLHTTTILKFQDGPPAEGVNGLTNEALLAVVLDRLGRAQSGPFRCRENALAITKLEEALHWMLARTRERAERGVEGTHEV